MKSCSMEYDLAEFNVSYERWRSPIFTHFLPTLLGLTGMPSPYCNCMYDSCLINLPKAVVTKHLPTGLECSTSLSFKAIYHLTSSIHGH